METKNTLSVIASETKQSRSKNTPCHSRENGNPAGTCVCHRIDPFEAGSPVKPRMTNMLGFTLVELIVVITILVILGTIAFTSLSGFSGSARDSDRITTLKNLESGLSLYQIKTGTYPLPEDIYGTGTVNGVSLVYAWYAKDRISRFAQMNKTPIDPLSKDFYVYGTDITQQYYQIATTLESPVAYGSPNVPLASLVSTAYADRVYADTVYQAKVIGNYRGLLKSTNTVYNLPSLLFTGSGNLLSTGSYFVVDKSQNLPYKLDTSSSGTTQTTAQVFTLLGSSVTTLTGITLPTDKTTFLSQSGTYQTALGYPVDSIGMAIFWSAYLGSANVSWGGTGTGSSTPTVSEYSWALVYAVGQSFTLTGATVTVNGAWVGTSSTKADSNCNTNDIAIWSGSYVQIWAACNVGANTAYDPAVHNTLLGWSGALVSSDEPTRKATYSGVINSATNFLGNYYQWGRNDPVNLLGTGLTSASAITQNYQIGGIALNSGNGFIVGTGAIYTWINDANHNTSSGTVWTDTSNSGPCPSDYRLPTGGTWSTATDWGMAGLIMNSQLGTAYSANADDDDESILLRSVLKLPLPGTRSYSTGVFDSQGQFGYYWASSPYASNLSNAHYANFYSGGGNIAHNSTRAFGFSARCLKN